MFCILYSWHTCNIILEIVLARALLTDPPLLNFPHTLQNKNIPLLPFSYFFIVPFYISCKRRDLI